MKEIECIPDPSCRCCVCVGKFCNVDHHGHWHGDKQLEQKLKFIKNLNPRNYKRNPTGRQ